MYSSMLWKAYTEWVVEARWQHPFSKGHLQLSTDYPGGALLGAARELPLGLAAKW